MALLILEAIGPKGEELAMKAGDQLDIPVGFDPEFESATFDSETIAEDDLQVIVFEALGRIDPDWQSHLRLAE